MRSRICVVSTSMGFVRDGRVYCSGRRPLTTTPAVQESEPSWGEGDRTIVYTATIAGRRQIRLLQLGDGATRRIAARAGEDWSPALKRDGSALAFASTRDGAPAIYVAKPDGSDVQPFHTAPPAPPDPSAPPPPTIVPADLA